MNSSNLHENNLDESLQRAAAYLARRGSEYLEHPVQSSASVSRYAHRHRRVLVGAAAAATLCVTALAGSFIGGRSSGKVENAKAAWSALPQLASTARIEEMKSSCGVDETYIEDLEGSTWDRFPEFLLWPSLVEERGSTILAVYFTFHHAVMCIKFEDQSITKTSIAMSWQEDRWREPFAAELKMNNNPAAGTSTVGTIVVGFLPGSKPIDPTNATGSQDSSSQWVVTINSPEAGIVTASVQQQLKRFVAWIPGIVSGELNFANTSTGEKEAGVKFDKPKYTSWNVSPITTVASFFSSAAEPSLPSDLCKATIRVLAQHGIINQPGLVVGLNNWDLAVYKEFQHDLWPIAERIKVQTPIYEFFVRIQNGNLLALEASGQKKLQDRSKTETEVAQAIDGFLQRCNHSLDPPSALAGPPPATTTSVVPG